MAETNDPDYDTIVHQPWEIESIDGEAVFWNHACGRFESGKSNKIGETPNQEQLRTRLTSELSQNLVLTRVQDLEIRSAFAVRR